MAKLKLWLIVPLLLLTSCIGNEIPSTDTDGNKMVNYFLPNFSLICDHGTIEYLRDTDTNLVYIYKSATKFSGLSVYYNSEGKPMTYDEFKIIHTAKYHEIQNVTTKEND